MAAPLSFVLFSINFEFEILATGVPETVTVFLLPFASVICIVCTLRTWIAAPASLELLKLPLDEPANTTLSTSKFELITYTAGVSLASLLLLFK